jgi:hypothetical protein
MSKIKYSILFFCFTTCLALGLSSCGSDNVVTNVLTGGDFNGATGRQLDLAKKSRADMQCCSITIVEYTEVKGVVNGCGQSASYSYVNSNWAQQSIADVIGWGTAADRLIPCTQ